MVKIRLKYRKISSTSPMARCWYCESPTNSALYHLDGSETWCCKKCHEKHGIIYKRVSKSKQTKNLDNNEGNNDKMGVIGIR